MPNSSALSLNFFTNATGIAVLISFVFAIK
jgi:hypothetical protein